MVFGLGAAGVITLLTLVFIIVTSIIWLPILLICLPIIVIAALLGRYTSLGKPMYKLYHNIYDWFFYKSERPRKFLWGFIYNMMCYLYPQTQWKAMNYGYAVLNDDGKLLKNLKDEDEDERFCL